MQISAEKIWSSAQEHLRVKLSRDTFNMWFAPLRPCVVDGHQLTMEAPNEFCEVWLKDNYLSLLQDAVAVAAGCRLQVKFRVNSSSPPASPASPAHAAVPTKARSVEPVAFEWRKPKLLGAKGAAVADVVDQGVERHHEL